MFEEDLVRFVPWDDNERQLTLEEQAQVRILLQEPKGNNRPVVLAGVLHSNVFLKRAATRDIHIDLPDEANENSNSHKNSSGSNVDTEVESRHPRKRQAKEPLDVYDRHCAHPSCPHTQKAPPETRATGEVVKARPKKQAHQSGSHHGHAKPVSGDESDAEQCRRACARARTLVSGDESDAEQRHHPCLRHRARAPVSRDESDVELHPRPYPRPRP
ncbi:hypothetical protein C8R42DRAFT_718585 [Lentinula raphanica]|nr:hypothetical protein C8R42DRAFT_718585 [Lentinula raphanica]